MQPTPRRLYYSTLVLWHLHQTYWIALEQEFGQVEHFRFGMFSVKMSNFSCSERWQWLNAKYDNPPPIRIFLFLTHIDIRSHCTPWAKQQLRLSKNPFSIDFDIISDVIGIQPLDKPHCIFMKPVFDVKLRCIYTAHLRLMWTPFRFTPGTMWMNCDTRPKLDRMPWTIKPSCRTDQKTITTTILPLVSVGPSEPHVYRTIDTEAGVCVCVWLNVPDENTVWFPVVHWRCNRSIAI